MKLFIPLGVFLLFSLWFVPELALAQGGFVTCDGTDCSACNLVEMGNTLIVWMFGIIFLIFAGLMVAAGFGLVTSAGNTSALESAKSKFTNAIIGVMIVMSAWLVVDTIMKGLVGGGNTGAAIGEIVGWGPWAEVKCQVQADTVPFTDINTGHGGAPGVAGEGQVAGSTVAGACNIPPLTMMTDPQALSMERGSPVIFNNPNLQRCANRFISQVGGGAKINSAFRPPEYQTHLWEIRSRWCDKGLKDSTDAACADLKAAVSSEVSKHFGGSWSCGAVAKTSSKHGVDGAVDIGGIANHADPSVQAKAAANCLVWKNYPGDPWHYDLKSGCTCP